MAFVELVIAPGYRSSGIGDRVLDQVYAIMRANDRALLIANAWKGSDLERFWLDHGLEMGSAAAQRRLHPLDLDWSHLDRLHAESLAASTAYEVVQVTHPVSDDLVEGMVQLQLVMNDAPIDDLSIDDDVWNAKRYRAAEAATANRRMTSSRARCAASRLRRPGRVHGGRRRRRTPAPGFSGRHRCRRRTPRSSARRAAQDRDAPPPPRGRAADRADRHLERRLEQPHDRRQRVSGLRRGRVRRRVPAGDFGDAEPDDRWLSCQGWLRETPGMVARDAGGGCARRSAWVFLWRDRCPMRPAGWARLVCRASSGTHAQSWPSSRSSASSIVPS